MTLHPKENTSVRLPPGPGRTVVLVLRPLEISCLPETSLYFHLIAKELRVHDHERKNLYTSKQSPDLPEEPGVLALDGVGLVVVRHQQVGHREQGGVPGGKNAEGGGCRCGGCGCGGCGCGGYGCYQSPCLHDACRPREH